MVAEKGHGPKTVAEWREPSGKRAIVQREADAATLMEQSEAGSPRVSELRGTDAV